MDDGSWPFARAASCASSSPSMPPAAELTSLHQAEVGDAPSARRRRGRCDLRGHGDAARASARLERRCGHTCSQRRTGARPRRTARPPGGGHVPLEDGLEIGALLFRPADRDAAAPAVVYPHGGPTEFYGDQWDGHAQYFVDKGYAWLALNYRGSTGRGKTFERLNFNDWGGGDV